MEGKAIFNIEELGQIALGLSFIFAFFNAPKAFAFGFIYLLVKLSNININHKHINIDKPKKTT